MSVMIPEGYGVRYDGVGITNNGIATRNSRPKARLRKCKPKKRKKNKNAPIQQPPVTPPVAKAGLGGFKLAGAQAQLSNLAGQGATRFDIASHEIKTVMNDADNGGYQVRVEGGQYSDGTGVKAFGIGAGSGATAGEVQVCDCGTLKYLDKATGKVTELGNIDDAGVIPVRILPNGVKISTALIDGKEKIMVEGNDYTTTADKVKDANGHCRYDLNVQEKAVDVASNATGIDPAPQFLNTDQIF
jgi:hypothetical protein